MKLKFSNHQVLFSETTYIVDKDRFLRCAKGAIALDIDADGWYCRRDTIINNPIHIKDGLKLILKDLQELRTYCNLLPDCNDSCLKKLTVYFTFQSF